MFVYIRGEGGGGVLGESKIIIIITIDMLTKNECDLIWKIRHGANPTSRFLYGCKYSDSPKCNYFGELDDLTHYFCYMQ